MSIILSDRESKRNSDLDDNEEIKENDVVTDRRLKEESDTLSDGYIAPPKSYHPYATFEP